MPVLVTPARRPLARRFAARLLEEGGEVRVYDAEDVAALRAAGAFVASGDSDDEGRLEAALTDVHTVVYVSESATTAVPDELTAEAGVLARAAANAGVRRLISLSVPDARLDAPDALRRAAAEAEASFAAVGCPSVVLRVSLVDEPAQRDLLATAGLGPEELAVEVAPVRAGDLAELVTAFDRARATAPTGHLVVAADGPVRTSVAGYLDRVGAGGPGRGSLVGRRAPDAGVRARLREVLLGGRWFSAEPWVLDGWVFAGLTPRQPGPS